VAQQWRPPRSTWAGLFTDSNRLFPGSPTRSGEEGKEEGAKRPALAVLCETFPELGNEPNFATNPYTSKRALRAYVNYKGMTIKSL
jgi:hypothetical protein